MGKVYCWSTNVLLGDIDLFGVTYYLKYIEWCNRAREECILKYIPNDHLNFFMPVIEMNYKFIQPAKLGDNILIEIFFDEVKRTHFRVNFILSKTEGGSKIILGTHYQKVAYLDKDQKICRISNDMLKVVQEYTGTET